MISVANAVQQVVASSDFAIEGLQTGCLNLTAYASLIKGQVEQLTMKPVRRGSIVVALARLAKKYYKEAEPRDYMLLNLVSRTGLTELTYPKSLALQKRVVKLFERSDIQTAPFCVATLGLGEISIVTHNNLAQSIREELRNVTPVLCLQNLSSLTLQVGIETIDMPHQSYAVIKQLALRNITIVEYLTSPSELTVVLHDRDLKNSFAVLHDRFFKTA